MGAQPQHLRPTRCRPSSRRSRVICGAGGVVGTEIPVHEDLASEFGSRLIYRVLAGQAVGRAVLETRRVLLANENPMGLAYSLYAFSEFKLALTLKTPVQSVWASPRCCQRRVARLTLPIGADAAHSERGPAQCLGRPLCGGSMRLSTGRFGSVRPLHAQTQRSHRHLDLSSQGPVTVSPRTAASRLRAGSQAE